MKTYNMVKKFGSYVVAPVSTALLVTGQAIAAVPLGVDAAVTAAEADAVTVAGYVLIALAGLVAITWMIKIIRKA